MTKKRRFKSKKQDVCSVLLRQIETRSGTFWNPVPYDKNNKRVETPVDCVFNEEFFSREDAKAMLRAI